MPSRRPEAAPHARDGTSLVPWVCIATLVCVFCANRLLVAWGDSHWLRDHLILEGRFFKARWWTPLTYSLLHLDLAHLAVNGAGLALFGRALGESWSGSRLAVLTLLSALGGAALWLAFHHGQRGAVTGASAVLAGYVAAYVLDRPCEKIPLPGPADRLPALAPARGRPALGTARLPHAGNEPTPRRRRPLPLRPPRRPRRRRARARPLPTCRPHRPLQTGPSGISGSARRDLARLQ